MPTVSCSPLTLLLHDVWQYVLVLQRHPGYRYYLISHICQDVGMWFVKIGAVLTVERFQESSSSSSGKAVAYLMLTIMLPQVFLSPLGGILADNFDRRRLMIALDILSGTVVFGYLLALQWESLAILYLSSTLRTALTSIYDPITRSILPMIVPDADDLKRAVSINYLAWSLFRILGGLMAGYSTKYVGIGVCFLVDCISFFISAAFLCCLSGTSYRVSKVEMSTNSDEARLAVENSDHCDDNGLRTYHDQDVDDEFVDEPKMIPSLTENASVVESALNTRTIGPMETDEDDVGREFVETTDTADGQQRHSISYTASNKQCCHPVCSIARQVYQVFAYLSVCGFGWLALMRTSGSAVWGWADVLNVVYTHVDKNQQRSSEQLGILMSFLGGGTLIGPPLANFFTDPHRPSTLQRACIVALGIMTLGWIGIIIFGNSFFGICGFSMLRTLGASILITNSTLLLQYLCRPDMLGRVLALEYATSMGVDSLTNFVAGSLQDKGLAKELIAAYAATVGALLCVLWTCYHNLLGGRQAAEPVRAMGNTMAGFSPLRSSAAEDGERNHSENNEDQVSNRNN